MKKLITIVAALVLAIGASAAIKLWVTGGRETTETRVTIESVKDVARLATIKAHVATDTMWEKPKPAKEDLVTRLIGKLEWKKARLMVLASAIVEGQVDLDKAKITVSPSPEDRWLKVTFPPGSVQIRDPQLAPGDLSCLTVDNPNPAHPITGADRDTATAEALRNLKREALNMGIVEQTMAETATVLQGFLASLGYRAEVKFEATAEAEKARWL